MNRSAVAGGARRLLIVSLAATGLAALLVSCGGANAARWNRDARATPAGTQNSQKGMTSVQIESGGRTRNFLLYVPSSARPGAPAPLVLVFHGGGGSADKIAQVTRFHDLAEREGFIVAYPNGTFGRRSNGGVWNAGSGKGWGSAEKSGVNDVAFTRATLARIKQDYAIDPDRVYATGLSNGAMMTYFLACNMADEFAAIAPVAGTMIAARCEPTEPVAVFHIHGTQDTSVPFEGGAGDKAGGGHDWPSVTRAIDFWKSRDRCSAEKSVSKAGPETTCQSYRSCARDVTLCLIDRGGHAWPGQTPATWQNKRKVYVTQSFDATSQIWQYFRNHPKS